VPSRINSAPSRTPWSFTCSPDSPSTRARHDSDALILAGAIPAALLALLADFLLGLLERRLRIS
jgi:hypothetical protein